MPDDLVAILLDLKALCEGDVRDLPHEARHRINNACRALTVAVGNAAAIASYINRLSARADSHGVLTVTASPPKSIDDDDAAPTRADIP